MLHYGHLTDSTNLIRIIQQVQPDVANDSLIPTAPHDLQQKLRTGRLCLETATCM